MDLQISSGTLDAASKSLNGLIMADESLSREREGLQLAKFFLNYCFNVNEMLTMADPSEIIKVLKPYGLKICDDCGGAMCDTGCPVSRYVEDMDKWLKGEKTVFAKEHNEKAEEKSN